MDNELEIAAGTGELGAVDKQNIGHTSESKRWGGLREVKTGTLFSDAALPGHAGTGHLDRGAVAGAFQRLCRKIAAASAQPPLPQRLVGPATARPRIG